jgi:HEAT repeat protein
MFVLGCFERPATLYMQQVRALNLIHALNLRQHADRPKIIIVGAGAAGITAAAAAAMCGCDVTVVERIGNEVLSLAGSAATKRWLHPHIYDWPAEGKERLNAGLPLLDWVAGPAHKVVEHLRAQWVVLERELEIETHLGVTNVRVSPMQKGYLVQWNGRGPRAEGRPSMSMHAKRVDLVILAVGFGLEEPTETFPKVQSYWSDDDVDRNLDGQARTPLVLVSGTGDGGLIDALRYCFRDFKHEDVLTRLERQWLGPELFAQVRERLCAIEDHVRSARAAGQEHEALLNWSYRELIDSTSLKARIAMRQDVDVVLTGTSAFPLTLEAAPINRFLLALTNAQYVPGPVTEVKELTDGRWKVRFRDDPEAKDFDRLVIRHGPNSAMGKYFPEIVRSCDALVKSARSSMDPTREPHFDPSFFDDLLEVNERLIPKLEQGGDLEVFAAIRSARPDRARKACDESYRAAIVRAAEAQRTPPIAAAMRLVPVGARSGGAAPSSNSLSLLDASWLGNETPAIRYIVGPPGSGKSTMLRQLAVRAARDPSVFPVRLSSQDALTVGGGSVFHAAVECAVKSSRVDSEADRSVMRALLVTRLFQGRLLVLLDGIDEVPAPHIPELFAMIESDAAHFRRGNRLIAVARQGTTLPRFEDVQILETLPWKTDDALSLLAEGEDVDAETRHAWKAMLSSPVLMPVLLWPPLLGLLKRARADNPHTQLPRLDVLGWVLDLLTGYLDKSSRRALGLLAASTLASHEVTFSREQALSIIEKGSKEKGTPIDSDELLANMCLASASPAHALQFAQHSIHEALAARHFAAEMSSAELVRLWFDDVYRPDVCAMAIGWSHEFDRCSDLLRSLPDSLDWRVLCFTLRTHAFRRVPRTPNDELLARQLADIVADQERCSHEVLGTLAAACVGVPVALASAILTALAPQLTTDAVGERIRVLEFLAQSRLPGAMPLAAAHLPSSDERVRDTAAGVLANMRDPAGIPLLLDAYLHGSGGMVFSKAIEAIGTIGGQAAREALVQVLSDQTLYRNLRWPAAEQLGRLADPSAVPALLAATSDSADVVRGHAAEALGHFQDGSGLERLVACLSDEEVFVRIAAAKALARVATPREVPHLLRALDDEHVVVKSAAASALLRLDPDELLRRVRRILEERSNQWRAQAVVYLGDLLGAEVLGTLLALAREADEDLRRGAAEALGRHADPGALAQLIELTRDPSTDVRYAAITALATRTEDVVGNVLVERLSADRTNEVGLAAATALSQRATPAARAALRASVELADAFSSFSAHALGRIGEERDIALLAASWRKSAEHVRMDMRSSYLIAIGQIDGPLAAATLRDLLSAESDGGRVHVVRGLGAMRDPSAVPPLLSALTDTSGVVRSRAIPLLQALTAEQIRSGLVQALRDSRPAIVQLAAELCPYYANADIERALAGVDVTPWNEAQVARLSKAREAAARRMGL